MGDPVQIVRHSLRGYKTFVDEAVLDFPQGGVVVVRSLNTQTRTTSGCGKTALLRSFSYTPGFGPATTEVLSWHAESVRVESTLLVGARQVQVVRGSERLLLDVPGESVRRGAEAEAWLRTHVGDPKLASAVSWRPQRARGNFFSLQPGKKREFLAKLLLLEKFEEVAERAGRAVTALSSEQQRLEAQLASCREHAAQAAATAPPELPPVEARDHSSLTSQVQELRAALQGAEALLETRSADFRAARQEVSGALGNASAALRTAEREAAAARARLAAIRDRRCPTCGARADLSEPVEPLQRAVARAEELASEVGFLREALGDVTPPPDVVELTDLTAQLRCELSAQESELRVARARAESDARARLRAEQAAQRHAQLLRSLREEEARLQVQHGSVLRSVAEERDFSEVAGRGFVSRYLAEFLADLSATADLFLQRVPNVAACSVLFEPVERGERVEVGTRVFVGGVERGGDPLSGGQESSVELAADLALASVIRARGASRVGWSVLDEPFEGMGQPDREAFVEILSELPGPQFLVDGHARELRELFVLQGIGVTFDGRTARIVSAEERAHW